MFRRLFAAAVTAAVLAFGGAPAVRGDQATLLDFVEQIGPGETAEWSFTLVIAAAGIPNVAYENADSFAVGETVTATITPIVQPDGFGTVELISDDTLTGTAPDDSKTGDSGEFGEITFTSQLTIRYTAPSLEELGCTDHPGERFFGHVGVLADFSGDAGTRAHIDPEMGGQGWVGAAVPLEFECPLGEPTTSSAEPTLPPTDTSPAGTAGRTPAAWMVLPLIAIVTGLLALTRSWIRTPRDSQ
jgi:hypothetical protein